jgi:hypothetical protein
MGRTDGSEGTALKVQLMRAYRKLNGALEKFYEKKYEQAVELCSESLGHLLPENRPQIASPEEQADLFMKTYSAILPVHEGQDIAAVFTFFQDRRARFRIGGKESIHHRDWWEMIRVRRDEADGVIAATRAALGSLEQLLPMEE